ncbi:MAG: molecular chaperone DnaJ [Streptosporangiaceae bacterium]
MTPAEAIGLIEAAAGPDDLFGADPARSFRRLARLTHPDAGYRDPRAERAFARLADLWRRYRDRDRDARVLVACGDLANLYRDPRGLLKVSRDPADNDLIEREARALARISARGDPRLAAYFPELIAAVRVPGAAPGATHRGHVIAALEEFVSLAQVRAAFPGGVHPADAAWMWRRLLVAVGAAHRAGVIHGAVLPDHVLIHPAEHGLVLIDWCYAGPGPAHRVPAVVARHRASYPPEILAGRPAGPDADIWLATMCMTSLIGDQMPAPLATFARGCLLARPRSRPDDAWRLLAELDEVLARLLGPRRFRPFAMPAHGS